MVSSDDVLDIQGRLRALLAPGVSRLHWRNDRPKVRRRHLEWLSELHQSLGLRGFEAHVTLSRAKREEAGRTKCLAALAGHLALHDVGELIIESRQAHQDARDSRVLLRAREDGVIPRDMQWRYGRPLGEPMLWIPDAVAGVVGHYQAGRAAASDVELLPQGFPTTVWAGDA